MSETDPIWKERAAEAARHGAGHADFVLLVCVRSQRMRVWCAGREQGVYPVSTSRFGLGDTPGSQATPEGWHAVRERHGLDEPIGRVFESREPRPEVLEPARWAEGGRDLILTRILRLDGLEPGRNGNSHARYIYIHGTNQEDHLGQPASHGCIRMANRDVAELFNLTLRHAVYCWIG